MERKRNRETVEGMEGEGGEREGEGERQRERDRGVRDRGRKIERLDTERERQSG